MTTNSRLYVVKTVHFGIKLYNDQHNAQVFKFIYLFSSPSHVSGFLLAHLQKQVYNFKPAGYGVSARALTPYPAGLKLVIIQFQPTAGLYLKTFFGS
jgi:hypothetical protein